MVLVSVWVAVAAATPSAASLSTHELPPVDCVRLIRDARLALDDGRRAEGLERLREAVRAFPREVLPVLELWSAYRNEETAGSDTVEIRAVLAERLADPRSALPPGVLEQLAGHPEARRDELLRVREAARVRLAAQPEDLRLLNALARLEERLGLIPEMRATLGRLLALEEDPSLRWRLIDLDIALDRWDGVLALLTPWLDATPPEPLVRALHLTALGKLGRVDALSRELARLESDDRILREGIVEILLQAAWDLRDAGRDTEAEGYFRRVLAADAGHAEARAAVMHLYSTAEERLAQAAQAAAAWESETDAQRLLDRGTHLFAAGDAEGALPLLRRAAEALPDSEIAWFNLGLCAFRLERWEPAIEALTRSIAIAPGRAEALVHRGAALSELARCGEAIADLEGALTLQPELKQAYYYLSVCHRDLGDEAAARRAFRKYQE